MMRCQYGLTSVKISSCAATPMFLKWLPQDRSTPIKPVIVMTLAEMTRMHNNLKQDLRVNAQRVENPPMKQSGYRLSGHTESKES